MLRKGKNLISHLGIHVYGYRQELREKPNKKKSLLQNSNSGSQFLHCLEEETYVKQLFSR